jgi:hypothetical protein
MTIWHIQYGIYQSTLSVIGCQIHIKVALSACHCQLQVCHRSCCNIEERNTMLYKAPEIQTNLTGQLTIWLERLTPDREDVSSNPLCGMNSEL